MYGKINRNFRHVAVQHVAGKTFLNIRTYLIKGKTFINCKDSMTIYRNLMSMLMKMYGNERNKQVHCQKQCRNNGSLLFADLHESKGNNLFM